MRKFFVFDLGETLIDFKLKGLWHKNLKNEVIPLMFENLKQFKLMIPIFPLYSDFLATAFEVITLPNVLIRDKKGRSKSMEKRIMALFNRLNIPIISKLIRSQFQAFHDILLKNLEIYDDVHYVLRKLYEKKYSLGLWSNTPWQSPGWIFESIMKANNILSYFSSIHFSGDYEIQKPRPETLEIVLNSTKFTKEDMIYIGNSEVDIQVGANFRIPTIWVKQNGDLLSEKCPQPTYSVNKLCEILDLLPLN